MWSQHLLRKDAAIAPLSLKAPATLSNTRLRASGKETNNSRFRYECANIWHRFAMFANAVVFQSNYGLEGQPFWEVDQSAVGC